MPFKKNTKVKLIGFLPDEWEAVCRKAEKAKLRTGTFIRRIAVEGEIKIYSIMEVQHLIRAFGSIGTNLDQIAKVANAVNPSAADEIVKLQEQYRQYEIMLKDYLRELETSRGLKGVKKCRL